LLISETPATKEALELADPDVVKGRMRRLKRASDLSYKAKMFKMELSHDIQKIKARDEEYALLDLYKK
jgi:ubiquinol-cytochrome c reductase subunit 7